MPELPEVEHFRRLLLPLVNQQPLQLALVKDNPPRKFITTDQIDELNAAALQVQEVRRRGKQICMVLGSNSSSTTARRYLYVHMGMTGRISTPTKEPQFGHFSTAALSSSSSGESGDKNQPDEKTSPEYPPIYTYLTFQAGEELAAFSDPRKFGKIYVADDCQELEQLAPDAWEETFPMETLQNQRLGVKALLLDQKRVVSGVGNWVADELLYQTEIHPLQTHLNLDQVQRIQSKLPEMLGIAVDCLDRETNYPGDWIFHYRWVKGKTAGVKDAKGRAMQFLTAGGRTTAIVPTIQKWKKSQGKDTSKMPVKIESETPKSASSLKRKRTKNSEGVTEETNSEREKAITSREKPEKVSSAKVPKRRKASAGRKVTPGTRRSPRFAQ